MHLRFHPTRSHAQLINNNNYNNAYLLFTIIIIIVIILIIFIIIITPQRKALKFLSLSCMIVRFKYLIGERSHGVRRLTVSFSFSISLIFSRSCGDES